ncbi:MAG: hypothetical protein HYZ47_05130 [Simkania negevensis]|nr:hypothetical protein [Simkania negevensis]
MQLLHLFSSPSSFPHLNKETLRARQAVQYIAVGIVVGLITYSISSLLIGKPPENPSPQGKPPPQNRYNYIKWPGKVLLLAVTYAAAIPLVMAIGAFLYLYFALMADVYRRLMGRVNVIDYRYLISNPPL